MDRYAALRSATADAMAVKWYFMFDNHSFLPLFANDVKASMAALRGLPAKRLAYGMLHARGEDRKHLHFHNSAENAEDLAAAEEWMQESATPKPKPEAKYYAAADPATIAELLAERDSMLAAMSKDAARLDYLDRCHAALNAHFGTDYRWKLIVNHNVVRLLAGRPDRDVDLHDTAPSSDLGAASSVREAIDKAMK